MENDPAAEITLIEESLNRGLIFDAHNRTRSALDKYPDNTRLVQLFGLTLAKLGATDRALEYMERLYEKGHHDPETSGILARIHKDISKKGGGIIYTEKSRDLYFKSYEETGDYYTGINASTMSRVLGESSRAAEIARRIIDSTDITDAHFWPLATLGEAYLIIKEHDKSKEFYTRAREAANGRQGLISSAYGQLLFISQFMDVPSDILEILRPSKVVFFTGHMIDRPGRGAPRFPDDISEKIKEQIKSELDDLDAAIGFCSAACGGDILFIEAMRERGAEVNVYLPFCMEDFLTTSVAFAGPHWIERFQSVYSAAAVRYVTEERYLGNDELFHFMGLILMGLTILTAELLHAEPVFLSVLDSHGNDRLKGGAGDLYDIWPNRDSIVIIDPSRFRSQAKAGPKEIKNDREQGPPGPVPYDMNRSLRSILFADIAGFSKVQEEQTPYFMYELLQAVSDSLNNLTVQPEILNTWGDALFAIYENPGDMMEFAFALNELITTTDWSGRNLPPETSIRIALHCGPVFIGIDPITTRANAYGTHINRAARIEPITIPGCIYASEQFASLLFLQTGKRYSYHYVGMMDLPKEFGSQEIYRISRYGSR